MSINTKVKKKSIHFLFIVVTISLYYYVRVSTSKNRTFGAAISMAQAILKMTVYSFYYLHTV